MWPIKIRDAIFCFSKYLRKKNNNNVFKNGHEETYLLIFSLEHGGGDRLTNPMCSKHRNSTGVTDSHLTWPVCIFLFLISVLAHYTVICQNFFFKKPEHKRKKLLKSTSLIF